MLFDSAAVGCSFDITQDPAVQKRALQLCSELTSHILRPDTSVPLAIAERVLSKRTSGRNDLTPFGEALRDLYTSRSRILQKLAMKFPDKFMVRSPILPNLTRRVIT